MSHEHRIDQEIRAYWEGGGEDLEAARRVLGQSTDPSSPNPRSSGSGSCGQCTRPS
jgi:hypothetical protein